MKKVSSNTGQEPHFLQNYFLLNTFANMYAFQSYSCDLRVPVCDWLFSFIIAVESGQVGPVIGPTDPASAECQSVGI